MSNPHLSKIMIQDMKKRILLVEDELGLRITIGDRLKTEGYEVETASEGQEGYEKALAGQFDILLLDIMLPRKSGLDICRDLRQNGKMVPVLMLTALGQTLDKVLGLKIGADDYLTKPFEMPELLARIEALLRRSAASALAVTAATYQFGSVRVDFKRSEVFREEKPVSLSALEFQLLRYFIEHRGETLSREILLQEVWSYSTTPYTRTVDVHVAWLRQKLEDDPKQPVWIETIYGLGYKFTG
jgi:two-component system, OmpR family, alkaline phosphatase synthesis response regulator PhoP